MENYVFVYGSLKSGFHNHKLLEEADAIFVGEDVTSGAYRMGGMGGSFPAVVERLQDYHIAGEIYKVDNETLALIDQLEGNGTFYERKLIETKRFDQYVWIYFLIDGEQIITADPCITIEGDVQRWENPYG